MRFGQVVSSVLTMRVVALLWRFDLRGRLFATLRSGLLWGWSCPHPRINSGSCRLWSTASIGLLAAWIVVVDGTVAGWIDVVGSSPKLQKFGPSRNGPSFLRNGLLGLASAPWKCSGAIFRRFQSSPSQDRAIIINIVSSELHFFTGKSALRFLILILTTSRVLP